MKIENQVCSLKQAKRLKELGVDAPSLFYYAEIHMDKRLNEGLSFEQEIDGFTEDGKAIWGSYKSAALFSNLPKTYYPLWIEKKWMLEHLLEGGVSWDNGEFEHDYLEYAGEEIPAYTLIELGILLPASASLGDYNYFHRNNWKGHSVGYSQGVGSGSDHIEVGWFENETHARAELLIRLLESELISGEQANARLQNS